MLEGCTGQKDAAKWPTLGRWGNHQLMNLSDVLPLSIGQNGFLLLYPLVSELLAASGAKPVLAAEADFLLV